MTATTGELDGAIKHAAHVLFVNIADPGHAEVQRYRKAWFAAAKAASGVVMVDGIECIVRDVARDTQNAIINEVKSIFFDDVIPLAHFEPNVDVDTLERRWMAAIRQTSDRLARSINGDN